MVAAADILEFLKGELRRNAGLKLLALGLAAALWWFVAAESQVQIGYVVPLEIRNLPAGMAITNKVERQVEVRLAGPSSLLGAIRQQDLVATIDLAGAKPGRDIVRLTERSVNIPFGVRVERVYPTAIDVSLEKLERKTLPVAVRIGGPANLRRRIAETAVKPEQVEVEALPGDLARLRSVSTEEVVPDASRGVFTAKARVELPVEHARIVGNPVVQVTVRFVE
jgi:YbbR domain-containing protein